MLDWVPAQLRVVRITRPKYACRTCNEVVQAAAPERLIAGGLATPALPAQVLVSKYCDHTPLYRRSQIFARHGTDARRWPDGLAAHKPCMRVEPSRKRAQPVQRPHSVPSIAGKARGRQQRRDNMSKERFDIHQHLADRIVSAIEAGAGQWWMPGTVEPVVANRSISVLGGQKTAYVVFHKGIEVDADGGDENDSKRCLFAGRRSCSTPIRSMLSVRCFLPLPLTRYATSIVSLPSVRQRSSTAETGLLHSQA